MCVCVHDYHVCMSMVADNMCVFVVYDSHLACRAISSFLLSIVICKCMSVCVLCVYVHISYFLLSVCMCMYECMYVPMRILSNSLISSGVSSLNSSLSFFVCGSMLIDM